MKFLSTCVVKTIDKCVAGELIRVPYSDTSALAVVLVAAKEGDAIVGYLSAPDELPSYYARYDTSDRVVSFGTDWVIEPMLDDDSTFSGNYTSLTSGSISITPAGPAIMFKASRSTDGRPVYHLLSDWSQYRESTNTFAPIPGYVIWANGDDYSRPDPVPLFAFGSAANDD